MPRWILTTRGPHATHEEPLEELVATRIDSSRAAVPNAEFAIHDAHVVESFMQNQVVA